MPSQLYFLYTFQSTTSVSLLQAKVKFSLIAVLTHSQELNSQVQGRCKILMTRLLNTIRNTRRVLTTLVVVALLVSSRHPTLLDRITEDGRLIVVTRNNPTTYYEERQGATGYEYELVKSFADYLGVELELMVVDNLQTAMEALENGNAHISAAGFTKEQTSGYPVVYGPTYSSISEQIVYRLRTTKPESIEDLQTGRLMVPARSRHARTLRHWQKTELPSLSWRETSELDASDLLQMVSDRELDFTLVNSNEFRLMRSYLPNLDVAFTLGEIQTVAWVMPRRADDSLRDRTFDFFYRPETGVLMAELSERFYGHVGQFDYVGAHRFLRHSRKILPRYEKDFKAAAEKHGFDWRLLAAMGYQESHWNPRARSFTGVRGLMMLTLRTAGELGVTNRLDPSQSIAGGSRYLAGLRERLDESVREPDRTWMALAAYNVGFGHLEDARRLAEKLGRNPDLWIDVKKVLPLLAQQRYYRQTRYGYARGQEPVTYVQNIRRYYDVLIWNEEQVVADETDNNDVHDSDVPVTVIPPLL